MKDVVEKLKDIGKTISTMESCTGGAVASALTDIEGSSDVLKFSAVTYSNEFKIKMGVDPEVINKYSVYSEETAISMSKRISEFAESDYGVGITGKLNRFDKNNPSGADNRVYISIYDKEDDRLYNYSLDVTKNNRKENKEVVIEFIKDKLLRIL